jgi:hypothetical protein
MDRSAPTQAIIELQAKCCRCIPKNLCVVVSAPGGETSSAYAPLGCGPIDDGPPIQYSATINIDGQNQPFRLRLEVREDDCYIVWSIGSGYLRGERLIDPSEPPDPYECNHGQQAAACAQFGGEWAVDGYAVTISEPQVIEVADLLGCAGCNCICRCLCVSIYSRSPTGVYTLYGTNEIVCADVTERLSPGCGDPVHFVRPKSASWTTSGWTITLQDDPVATVDSYVLHHGTEAITSLCDVRAAVWKTDGKTHAITDSGGIDVEYRFQIDADKTALQLQWVGRSFDGDSATLFYAYNWQTAAWDLIAEAAGRPNGSSINRVLQQSLDAAYTGAGANDGKVHVRLVSTGSELITDQLRVITNACCGWSLTPPGTLTFSQPFAKVYFSDANPCPSPTALWTATDYDGTEWFISAGCSWCNNTCGTVATGCCPRPLGPTLFFEGLIDCENCPGTVSLPLEAGPTGAIWSGETIYCGQTLTVTFFCNGSAWQITITLGACTYAGAAALTECDPLSVDFAGQIAGGLGCCGPGGDPFATPNFTGTVFE